MITLMVEERGLCVLYGEFSEASHRLQPMGLFVRLACNHADALEKLISWSYLNHLPTFSWMGVSQFRLHRVKIPEPKQTPGEDGSLCVVSCTEWAGTLKS